MFHFLLNKPVGVGSRTVTVLYGGNPTVLSLELDITDVFRIAFLRHDAAALSR